MLLSKNNRFQLEEKLIRVIKQRAISSRMLNNLGWKAIGNFHSLPDLRRLIYP